MPRFFSKGENQIFIPRGANYTRLGQDQYHNTFDPQVYDRNRAEAALIQMQSFGYNSVRVFLTSHFVDSGFGKTQPGVDATWLANVVDFIRRASCHKIRVTLTGAWLPANYNSIAYSVPPPPKVSGVNNLFLNPQMIKAQAVYWRDLISAIKVQAPQLMSSIFSIDLINEAALSLGDEPFSLHQGVVSLWGGRFDMALANDRQRLADVSASTFMNTIAAVIKDIDPELLLSTSVFTPRAVGHSGFDGVRIPENRSELRYPLRPLALVQTSRADYIDVHVYPASAYTLATDLASVQLDTQIGKLTKPLIMGEFGAVKFLAPSLQVAVSRLRSQLLSSCQYGFAGWGLWTWDTTEQQPAFWTGAENGGALSSAISPRSWPRICQ